LLGTQLVEMPGYVLDAVVISVGDRRYFLSG